MNALKALVNKGISNDKKDEVSAAQNKLSFQQEKPDFYEKLFNEMVLDMRAHPSDRTKTLEEIVQEEKEQLERLEVAKQSQKFCPEAIMFIRTLLMAALDKIPGQCQESQLYHLMKLKALTPLLCVRDSVNKIIPPDFLMLMDLPEASPYFSSDNFRTSMLVAVVETLRGFVKIYEGFNSFPEIFLPISKLLVKLAKQEHLLDSLKDKSRDVAQVIEKKRHEHHMMHRPLQMRKQKPVPIKLLNPKFEEKFVKGRDYDPDCEQAEMRKLTKLVKREAKGAARELRKDNYFLFEVKEKR